MHSNNSQSGNIPLTKRDRVCLPFDQDEPSRIRTVEMIVVRTALTHDFARRVVVLFSLDGASAEIHQTASVQMDVDDHPRWKFGDRTAPLVRQIEIRHESALVLRHKAKPRCLHGRELPPAGLRHVIQRGRCVEQRLMQTLYQLTLCPHE